MPYTHDFMYIYGTMITLMNFARFKIGLKLYYYYIITETFRQVRIKIYLIKYIVVFITEYKFLFCIFIYTSASTT